MPSNASSKKQIIKDSAHYLTSTVLAQGLGLLRTLLIPILLGPAQLGVWNLMNVIVGYGANAHLGILHGLNKKIPYLRGLGKFEEIDELKDSVFWFNLLLGISAGGLLLITSFLIAPIYAFATRIIAFVIVLQMVYVFYFCMLRGDSRFNLVSKGIVLFSFFSSILVVMFAYVTHERLLGALYGLSISYVIVVLYWVLKAEYRFTFSVKLTLIKESFLAGLPLIVIGLMDMVLLTVDRWLIAWQLSSTSLGYYSLGIMASNLLGLVPTSAANVLYPRMLERFAKTHDPAAVCGYLLNPMRVIASLMIFLIGAATILIPVIIKLLLPKYITSIPLIEILVPGAYFLAIAPITGSFVIAINRQNALVMIQVGAICLGLIVDGCLLYLGYGIYGIAYGTICCYAIYGIGYLFIALYLSGDKLAKIIWTITEVLLLFTATIVALKATNIYSPSSFNWETHLLSALIKLLIFCAVVLPVVWLVNRNSGLFASIKSVFFNKSNVHSNE